MVAYLAHSATLVKISTQQPDCTSMLIETTRHEALTNSVWDPALALKTIQRIVDDAHASRLPQGHWPSHPLDSDEGDPATGFNSI